MADEIIGITGSEGFIGRVLSDYLKENGYSVKSYNCDFSKLKEVEDLFLSNGAPKVLIHLAGRFSATDSVLINDNLIATTNILSVLKTYKKTKLIFSSTGAVYGNSGLKPVNELHQPNPNTYNGLVKFWCEQAINYYQKEPNKSAIILRLPSVYGENNKKGVIYHWLKSIKKDQQIIINGDGNQYRSFIHVLDVCSAIECCLKLRGSGTYNVSSNEFLSLNNLCTIFKNYLDFTIINEEKNNDLESMVLDSSSFIENHEWIPRYSVERYLKSLNIKQF
jgi:nucleoside-diphosphate-sugar epimerase